MGLGTIQPSQGDYFQAVKGGGHGDYKMFTLAPSTVQEMVDFVFEGFRMAEKYRTPAMILADGALGQMMEKVELPPEGSLPHVVPDWATTGKKAGRKQNVITSLFIQPEKMEQINLDLQAKYKSMEVEVKSESLNTEGADVVLVAFGLQEYGMKATELAAEKGIKVGVIRPITLLPVPLKCLTTLPTKRQFSLLR